MFQVKKKILICFLAVMMIMSSVIVSAEESIVTYGVEGEVVVPNVKGWVSPPVVTAETAVVMEMTTAICQYNKGRNDVRNPGELTKYMVMLLAVENCELEDEIKFSKEMILWAKEQGDRNLRTRKGEVMTVEDCLNAITILSSKEASMALAVHIAGSEEEFVNMMNARAAELGCDETHFAGITGLENEESYTSAYDVALIVRACLRNEVLRTIVNNTSYTIPKTNKSEKRKLVCEEPIILKDDSEYYEGTRQVSLFKDENGGYNMAVAAKRNEITYIVVTFGNAEAQNSYVDSKALLDYAHNNFEKSEFMIGTVVLPKTVSQKDINVKGTVEEGIVNQRYYMDGALVGKGSLPIEPVEGSASLIEEVLLGEEMTSNEESEISEDEMDEEDEIIDMVETVDESEYFKVFGLSLKQWNHVGTIAIILGVTLYMLILAVVRKVQRKQKAQSAERRKRISRYEED